MSYPYGSLLTASISYADGVVYELMLQSSSASSAAFRNVDFVAICSKDLGGAPKMWRETRGEGRRIRHLHCVSSG